MANFTSAELLAVIQSIEPVFNGLQFYKVPQLAKQRIYPCVEINETQPQSNDQSVQLINYKTKFEISIFIKYFDRNADTDNLDQLEDNLLDAIKAANLNTVGKLILETNDFQRGSIKDNPLGINGVQSVLVLYLQELAATVGIIGLQQTLDIGSITGLQLIGSTGSRGKNSTRRADTSGSTVMNRGENTESEYYEYMYTQANYGIIAALIDADTPITITLHEQGQEDTVLTGKPVYQRSTTRLDGQKTVILQFEAEY